MEKTRDAVFLLRSSKILGSDVHVFSTRERALLFGSAQCLGNVEVIEVSDLTRVGLEPKSPVEIYVQYEEPVRPSEVVGVVEKSHAEEHEITHWFDPMVTELESGLALYHAAIRNGRLEKPCPAYGCAGCQSVYSLAETPSLRRDDESEGVLHCFARSNDEAELIARRHFGQTWENAQVVDEGVA